ncbi:MAG: hypothetical protein Kow0059_15630 [Candidatus Sumerlaeia bacterium]
MQRLKLLILSVLALALLTACSRGPERIDPFSDEKVTSMEADYNELVEWSETLANRMLQDGFLDAPEYQPHPVRMVISDVENMTDISRLPKEMVLGRVRAALRSSQKVRVVSSYGREGTDSMTLEQQELPNDPRFKKPDNYQTGQLTMARLSLRTQFLMRGARVGRAAQNTYEVRMFVTDLQTGEVVWEGFSDPVAKKFKQGRLGL